MRVYESLVQVEEQVKFVFGVCWGQKGRNVKYFDII